MINQKNLSNSYSKNKRSKSGQVLRDMETSKKIRKMSELELSSILVEEEGRTHKLDFDI